MPDEIARSQYVTTSWDDGHPDDLRVADLLARYGLQATFYVPMQSPRARMTAAQIRELGARFEVGAHTVHHDDLTRLSPQQAKREIVEAKHRLEDLTGCECAMFCFPYGKYRRAHLRVAREAGYAGVRTTELLSVRFPARVNGMSVMPTTVQAYPHTPWAYLRNVSRRLLWRNAMNSMFLVRSTWVKTAESFAALVQDRGGVFHLWGHGWEIEEQGQWQQLDDIMHRLADCGAAKRSVPNSALCTPPSPVRAHALEVSTNDAGAS